MIRLDHPAITETLAARLARTKLSAAGSRVAQIVMSDPVAALTNSAALLASQARTSDATVIRTAQALGYPRLADLKRALAAELGAVRHASTPADAMRLTLAGLEGAALRSIDAVLHAHAAALSVVRSAGFRGQIDQALPLLHSAGRIVVFGIGPSGPLARYTAMLLGRAGRDACCLDASGVTLADQMLGLRHGDAVVALAYGRPYREVLGLLAHAGDLSIPVVVVTDVARGPLARQADAVLTIPRGQRGHVAMHAGTLLALEIVVLALAASQQDKALERLELLNRLRSAVLGEPGNV